MKKESLHLWNTEKLREITAPLLTWYRQNARVLPWRENTQPYRIWVSEIMLQQTRVETVIPYYNRFLQALPDIASLAQAEEESLLKLWEGLGYYTRVRNLQKAAQMICRDFGGTFPEEYEKICSLPGIGAYTAGAIASIAFEKPVPAVDGNVLRVLARLTEDFRDISKPSLKEEYAGALAKIYPRGRCGDFTQGLMELGAMVCVPGTEPQCGGCPLSALCLAKRNDTAASLPVKSVKPPRRKENLTVFLLSCKNRLALQKRSDSGLLGGLWELPNTSQPLQDAQALSWLQDQGLTVESCSTAPAKKHVFTHVEWHMTCYRAQIAVPTENFYWATPEELKNQIALPTAFKKCLVF